MFVGAFNALGAYLGVYSIGPDGRLTEIQKIDQGSDLDIATTQVGPN
jgi:hypothetical protein